MLLTDDSLRAEQTYHREALKRVNRYLWGSGIVCGLEVERISGLCIRVNPGVALDCHGNLIELCRCVTIDLTEECKKKYPGACIPPDKEPITRYLVVRYADVEADPQPVLTSDDACASSDQKTQCQHSKTREGFCLELREDCPTKACPRGKEGLAATFTIAQQTKQPDYLVQPECMELSPPCFDCGCSESYVGLAKLDISCSASDVKIGCECRSYILSPGYLRWIVCRVMDRFNDVANQTVSMSAAKARFPDASLLSQRLLDGLYQAAINQVDAPSLAQRVQTLEQQVGDLVQQKTPTPAPGVAPTPGATATPKPRSRRQRPSPGTPGP